MEPLEEEEEEEEEVEEQENVDGEELPQKTKKKKRVKRGPRGLWKQDLVDDLVDIIITNDYYPRKLIFVNTKNQQNRKVSVFLGRFRVLQSPSTWTIRLSS